MTVKELRTATGLSQSKFGRIFGIPTINISRWEQGLASPPEYVISMMTMILQYKHFVTIENDVVKGVVTNDN